MTMWGALENEPAESRLRAELPALRFLHSR
jgi:hypothetical protein